ncbi:methyl-accepting chemotaxis protein [Psychromonas ossibalaenae]|uniref:methyl-accepting chemotaxis protein n=1 Tax=Psychromonas ossibalaenae TaxID=444922 RepID=UPI00036E44BC|nr:methyl-accepting chemotaxis protein [Psychromonas ossibalaenae]
MLGSIYYLLSKFKLSRLMLILSLTVIVTLLISTVFSTNSVRTGVIAVEHQALSSHVVSLAKIVAYTQESVKQLPSKKLEALKAVIYPARWHSDDSGYAFLADGATGRYIIYPPKPAKEGNKMVNIELLEGGTLEQAIIRTSRRGIAEMVHYPHSKPGSDTTNLKAAYLYPIKESKSVLIAGEYLDKSDAILFSIYQKIFTPMALITLFVLIFVSILTRHLNSRADYLNKAMQRLAKGDLCTPVILKGRDEMAFLANALNISQTSLKQVLKQQADNGTNIAAASLQIDRSLNHTDQLIRSELGNLDQLASAMEEMVCSVAEVAENAGSASCSTQSTDRRAQQGSKQINESIQALEVLCGNLSNCAQSVTEVKDGVVSIDSVVDTIHAISEQTNMLALNAAIEAARAGEQGRGFAVVADEVRQLASRTKEATREITEMIASLNNQALSAVAQVNQSVSTAETGMNAAKSAGNEFTDISEDITLLNDSNLQIATAAEQQRNVAETMSQNINRLNTELAETSKDLGELASSSSCLKQQTDRLEEQLSSFSFEQPAQEEAGTVSPTLGQSSALINN